MIQKTQMLPGGFSESETLMFLFALCLKSPDDNHLQICKDIWLTGTALQD